jgi:cbb3-type cytochrome oxidase maturation protein
MRCACSVAGGEAEMESLYLLIPLSIVLVFLIGALFWWSLRTGQYDDLEGPAYRILLDDRDEFRQEEKDGEISPETSQNRGQD